MINEDYLRVGTIINTHGLKGELKIRTTTDQPEQRFIKGQQLFIQSQQYLRPVTLQSVRVHKGNWLLQIKEIADLTAAEQYRNCDLYIATADLPELPLGQYYYKDILGITVIDQTHGLLGKVVDIWDLGPNDVWTVRNQQGAEVLIPILKSVLLNVDLQQKKAQVDLPAGLIDED
ncbi:ribosome maturation factor RimM [Bombilactobacillus thymidiniphilus]|uniref:Ribosome maturation factor RimM n=1 Tax=Bombilactobacillus thymidiniphilus TaxID=2923363 RepID=A0ABY4PCQ8_9LACO|nr:ribosome maturation factor RimM [Bombilactobacillus thymidiniphilus]UQS83477.1 ribosome maturation factor RimM [Bombilactobacillus thymidiniphilus]